MTLEDRLYAILREAVGEPYASFIELANKIHEAAPPEYTYNRLEESHVMQPISIARYISLIAFLDLLRYNEKDARYECVLDEPPTPEGARLLITRKAIDCLEKSGFTRTAYRQAVVAMLTARHPIVPGLREIYQSMALTMPEANFLQLAALSDVRKYFGYSLTTRKILIPTSARNRTSNEARL
jgi:hypothetical protein